MKRLNVIILLCIVCMSVCAQEFKSYDKQTKKFLKTAEMYVKGFRCDSIVKVYPIYNVFRKKEFKDMKFDKIPKFEELEQYLDFKHIMLDNALVKTADNKVWVLLGKYNNVEAFAYTKDNAKDVSFFEYLETIKPEKTYSLFGQGYIVFEKDGKRQLYNRKREQSDLPEMYELYGYDLDYFNSYDFPKGKNTPLMIDYSK